MKPVRVLVTGGRGYRDVRFVADTLDRYRIVELAHGGADGADLLAAYWAKLRNVPVRPYLADWLGPCRPECRPGHRRPRGTTTYCPAAGPYRNQHMLEDFKPDLVIAFPGGDGTADMIARAEAAGVPVIQHARQGEDPDE